MTRLRCYVAWVEETTDARGQVVAVAEQSPREITPRDLVAWLLLREESSGADSLDRLLAWLQQWREEAS